MKKNYDEPMFTERTKASAEPGMDERMLHDMRSLIASQPFAVLATQGEGQPYATLVSYAFNEDLDRVYFATPRETRKYHLLETDPQVSLLLDNRSDQPDSINRISGLTVLGRARPLLDDRDRGKSLLMRRHPYLKRFLDSPATMVVQIDVESMVFVRRFQEVYTWRPKSAGSAS